MASEKVLELTSATFDDEVLKASGLVLVDFWAAWCGPCRMVGPVVEELADFYDGEVKVCKLNVDDNGEVAMRYQVMSIPTLLLFKDGQVVDKCVGARRRHEYEAVIEKHL